MDRGTDRYDLPIKRSCFRLDENMDATVKLLVKTTILIASKLTLCAFFPFVMICFITDTGHNEPTRLPSLRTVLGCNRNGDK
jgi:hypothetical protein